MQNSKRTFMKVCTLGAVTVAFSGKAAGVYKASGSMVKLNIVTHQKDRHYLKGKKTPIMAYNEGYPIIRLKRGQTLRVKLRNLLSEYTTIHWHGMRLPNEMDGVPVVTQKAVAAGEKFIYEFTPEDSGTFWFHTHMNSKRQMGRGMLGILIIEDETTPYYDRDIVWGYHDLNLKENGAHFPESMEIMTNSRGAAMGGVYGNFPTINGMDAKQNIDKVPAGGIVRLRILNMDNSRIMKLSLKCGDAVYKEAKVIAIDGNPVQKPLPFTRHKIGPAQRVDVAIKMPAEVGKDVYLSNVFVAKPYTLGILRTTQEKRSARRGQFPVMPRLNPIPIPNLKEAEVLKFELANMAVTTKGDYKNRFWGINNKTWGETDGTLPPPIVKLKEGKTYVFRLKNISKYTHPMHMHGHTWLVLKSSRKKSRVGYHTDTVLVHPREQIDLAFVADNVGSWMFHCHIIDHLMTGMMSYFMVGDGGKSNKAWELTKEEIEAQGGLCS